MEKEQDMNLGKKYRMKFLLLVMFIFPLAVSAKSYGETKNLSLPSDGISEMEIECGAGFLKLRGVEGLDEIKVEADIYAGNKKGEKLRKFIDKYLELSLEKHGDRAVLISRIEHRHISFFFMDNDKSRVDLTVQIPREMDIEIRDGSGEIELKNINGEIDLDDGSGSIDIADVNGNLEIHDGSGELGIHNVTGRMEIDDGSGSIEISKATGDVKITDGSGEINLDRIKGDLIIDDGSGSLLISDIDGNVRITDGSGPIILEGISSDVNIVESGSGGVRLTDVRGNVSGDL